LSGPVGKLATSGPDGTYAFSGLPPGKYSMLVDQYGFQFVPNQTNFELTNASRRQNFQGYTSGNSIIVQPSSLPVGSPDTVATIFGDNFNSSSSAFVGGVRLNTSFVEPTQLRITIPAYMMTSANTFDIHVVTDEFGPDRRVTQTCAFAAFVARPTLASVVTGANIVEGSPGTNLTLSGKGFLKDAKVKINGLSEDILTSFVDESSLVAYVPARYLARGGIYPVTVENPCPANVESNVQLLTVFYPSPSIDLITPATVPARLEPGAGAVNLDVMGYGFRRGAVVLLGGKPLATTYCENDAYCLSVHLYAKVAAADLRSSGFAEITVQNPNPSLATSNAVLFRINGLEPTITSVTPGNASVMNLSDKFSMPILINGTNFGPQTQVRIFKAGTQPPKYGDPQELLSSTQLHATLKDITYDFVGEWKVQVMNPQPGGGQSVDFSFLITEGSFSGNPFVLSISPDIVGAGTPGFTMIINGTNFRGGAQVQFNMAILEATVVSDRQIMVDIPGYLVENPGRVPISVINPDTGGSSNRIFLDIR
jgi:hypothetical protein